MDFLKYCMKVNGVTAYWPTRNEASREPLSANPNWRKKYYINNGVLAFVTENGDYYVTPYWREVAEELEKLGYSNAGMYVPFSNWDKPNNVVLAKEWEKLCADAKKESAKAEKTENIVKGKGLIDLPEEVYGMCLAVPEAGILVEKIDGGKQIDKIVDGQKIFDRIGTYCRNNGKLVFIDGKGDGYVTPFCYEVYEILKKAGYQSDALRVVLSNGESIVDPATAAKWKILDETAKKRIAERVQKSKEGRYREIAKERGLKDLPEEVYEMCLAIPDEGLETIRYDVISTTTPITEAQVLACMGVYYNNNNRLAFIDTNGNYYVTPFHQKVVKMLEDAGYQRGSLYVPLSNGEEITDPGLAAQWASLCEKEKNMSDRQSCGGVK